MRIYPVILLSAIGLAWAGVAMAQAPDFERGEALFEHQCHGCHGDLNFAKTEGKVKALPALRKKIAAWAEHSGADWGKGEVDDVLYYMDKSFYHFKAGKQ